MPTGIATDSSTSAFFGHLVSKKRLNGLFDFENKEGIFPGVHRSFKFSVLSIGPSLSADFAFFLHDVAMFEEKRDFFRYPQKKLRRLIRIQKQLLYLGHGRMLNSQRNSTPKRQF